MKIIFSCLCGSLGPPPWSAFQYETFLRSDDKHFQRRLKKAFQYKTFLGSDKKHLQQRLIKKQLSIHILSCIILSDRHVHISFQFQLMWIKYVQPLTPSLQQGSLRKGISCRNKRRQFEFDKQHKKTLSEKSKKFTHIV